MITSNVNVIHQYTINGCVLSFYRGDTGQGLLKHQHTYMHHTYCSSGSMKITMESGYEFIATPMSRPIELPANQWHEIEILEPNTAFVNMKNSELIGTNSNTSIIDGHIVRVY